MIEIKLSMSKYGKHKEIQYFFFHKGENLNNAKGGK